jgi:hypothetical protein
MVSRRDVITSGAVFSLLWPAESAAQRESNAAIVAELREIRSALRTREEPAWAVVEQIRERQRGFLRNNQKFPDRIDVGIRIWERVQDWHVLNQREIKIGRGADGRFEMEFMFFTTLVLRTDYPDFEIGVAYDR